MPSSVLGHGSDAYTLPEVVIAILMGVLMFGGVVYGYMETTRRAEWAAYSLAAQSLAVQRLEQTRAAKWAPRSFPAVDLLVSSNFPPVVAVLDVPIQGTNLTYATNYTTIRTVSTNPPLKLIQVDCAWRCIGERVFTSSIATYRAPDQ